MKALLCLVVRLSVACEVCYVESILLESNDAENMSSGFDLGTPTEISSLVTRRYDGGRTRCPVCVAGTKHVMEGIRQDFTLPWQNTGKMIPVPSVKTQSPGITRFKP
jgi:hypothetical protein